MTTRNNTTRYIIAKCVHCNAQTKVEIKEGEMLEYPGTGIWDACWVEFTHYKCLTCGEEDFSN